MLSDEVKQSIDECVLCWLATADANGIPNVSPKEMFIHHENGTLLIANIASPKSVSNIKANPNICVSFVEIFKQKGFKLVGRALYIEESADVFQSYLARLRTLGGERFPILGIIEVTVEKVEKIIAPSYWMFPDETTEESQVRDSRISYGFQ